MHQKGEVTIMITAGQLDVFYQPAASWPSSRVHNREMLMFDSFWCWIIFDLWCVVDCYEIYIYFYSVIYFTMYKEDRKKEEHRKREKGQRRAREQKHGVKWIRTTTCWSFKRRRGAKVKTHFTLFFFFIPCIFPHLNEAESFSQVYWERTSVGRPKKLKKF